MLYLFLNHNVIEITLWHGCFPVFLLDIFKTSFPKNNSRLLLLRRPDFLYLTNQLIRYLFKITFTGERNTVFVCTENKIILFNVTLCRMCPHRMLSYQLQSRSSMIFRDIEYSIHEYSSLRPSNIIYQFRFEVSKFSDMFTLMLL